MCYHQLQKIQCNQAKVFQILFIDHQKYEEKSPLRNMTEDEAYTIRNHSLESITCDDTGAYGCSNGNKKAFYVYISGTNVNTKNKIRRKKPTE